MSSVEIARTSFDHPTVAGFGFWPDENSPTGRTVRARTFAFGTDQVVAEGCGPTLPSAIKAMRPTKHEGSPTC